MGGLGRKMDGGYAEYAIVPTHMIKPFSSSLDWSTLGALPETFQTAMGCLTTGLDFRPKQTILIRGGVSTTQTTLIDEAPRPSASLWLVSASDRARL